jgi:hypothetical protein
MFTETSTARQLLVANRLLRRHFPVFRKILTAVLVLREVSLKRKRLERQPSLTRRSSKCPNTWFYNFRVHLLLTASLDRMTVSGDGHRLERQLSIQALAGGGYILESAYF